MTAAAKAEDTLKLSWRVAGPNQGPVHTPDSRMRRPKRPAASGAKASRQEVTLPLLSPANVTAFGSPPKAPMWSCALESTARFFKHFDDLLAFVNSQRQRLFTINILARLHGFDGNFRVPVIRRDDRHHVDIFAIQNLLVVLIDVDLSLITFFLLNPGDLIATGTRVVRIDVAYRGTV